MSVLRWNCQGLGNKLKIQTLKEMRREHVLDFMFLMETKIKSNFHVKNMQSWLCYENSHIVEQSGGLALF